MSRTVSAGPSVEAAERAVARLHAISQDLRGCAVIAAGGQLLASSSESEGWREAGAGLIDAADAAGSAPVDHVHVTTEDGEVFGVRHGDLVMVAVSERFTLASLMAFDMRTLLRGLGRE